MNQKHSTHRCAQPTPRWEPPRKWYDTARDTDPVCTPDSQRPSPEPRSLGDEPCAAAGPRPIAAGASSRSASLPLLTAHPAGSKLAIRHHTPTSHGPSGRASPAPASRHAWPLPPTTRARWGVTPLMHAAPRACCTHTRHERHGGRAFPPHHGGDGREERQASGRGGGASAAR